MEGEIGYGWLRENPEERGWGNGGVCGLSAIAWALTRRRPKEAEGGFLYI